MFPSKRFMIIYLPCECLYLIISLVNFYVHSFSEDRFKFIYFSHVYFSEKCLFIYYRHKCFSLFIFSRAIYLYIYFYHICVHMSLFERSCLFLIYKLYYIPLTDIFILLSLRCVYFYFSVTKHVCTL